MRVYDYPECPAHILCSCLLPDMETVVIMCGADLGCHEKDWIHPYCEAHALKITNTLISLLVVWIIKQKNHSSLYRFRHFIQPSLAL